MIDLSSCHLSGKRWLLRALTAADSHQLRKLLADSQLVQQSGMLLPNPDEGIAFSWALEQLVKRRDLLGLFAGMSLAGLISLTVDDDHSQQAELGYLLAASFRGRGMMTQSIQALLEWLKWRKSIQSVVAHVKMNNLSSIHVLEHCHFSIINSNAASHIISWQHQLKQNKEEL